MYEAPEDMPVLDHDDVTLLCRLCCVEEDAEDSVVQLRSVKHCVAHRSSIPCHGDCDCIPGGQLMANLIPSSDEDHEDAEQVNIPSSDEDDELLQVNLLQGPTPPTGPPTAKSVFQEKLRQARCRIRERSLAEEEQKAAKKPKQENQAPQERRKQHLMEDVYAFLLEQGLMQGCTFSHLARNLVSSNKPNKGGFEKEVMEMPFLCPYWDDDWGEWCVRKPKGAPFVYEPLEVRRRAKQAAEDKMWLHRLSISVMQHRLKWQRYRRPIDCRLASCSEPTSDRA